MKCSIILSRITDYIILQHKYVQHSQQSDVFLQLRFVICIINEDIYICLYSISLLHTRIN